MAIIGALPTILTNGTTADATQVMADFNFIVAQVNANAANAGANSNITSLQSMTTPLATTFGGTGASGAGAQLLQNIGTPAFLRGMIAGLQITAVGSSSVTISAGVCCDSSGANLITLPIFSKLTSGVWAAGSGANGLGTGVSLASSTTYHLHALAVGGSFDAYLDTSLTAANAPSGTTGYRRVMSVRTAPSSTSLLGLFQTDDTFLYTGVPIQDAINVAISATTAASQVLSVPLGLNVTAIVDAIFTDNAVGQILFLVTSLLQADSAVTASNTNVVGPVANGIGTGRVPTVVNASQAIRYRASGTSTTVSFITSGWIDQRGRTGLP